MILSDISVKRPVFATVLSLLVVIFGIISFDRLPLREYPDIDAPVVSIRTDYTGASANIIETRVTQTIEDSVSGIEGIKSISSESSDGRSSINIEFNINRDIDDAANDVRDSVNRVIGRLPDEVDTPQISKQDSDASPIMWLSLQSEVMGPLELTDYVDRYLQDRFSVIDGVANVRIGGERRYAMRVWLNRSAMAARNITVQDIETALQRENVELPAGRIESLDREFTVKVERVYNKAGDFLSLVIKRGDDGYLVKLSDIADVEIGALNERSEMRANGKNNVGIGITKQSNANTLAVARAVKDEVKTLQDSLPESLRLTVVFDLSLFIEAAIHEVYLTIFLTIIFVVAVIWAFLGDWRATMIPAVTIPVSLIGSFMVLYAMGFSINLVTILALILAIGLVVDDAIVVLENVYKRIEEGKSPLASSFLGARQVGFAVVATTLVLVMVFLPITFMPGDIGRLFTEFAWAMAAAVAFSSFAALSLTPVMCSKFLKQHPQGYKASLIPRMINHLIDRSIPVYRDALRFCIRKPLIIFAAMGIVGYAGWIFIQDIPSEFAPREDRGVFYTRMVGPEGSSLEYSKSHIRELEKILLELVDKGEARSVIALVPGFGGSSGVNGGMLITRLEDWGHRRHVKDIVAEMSTRFSKIPGVNAIATMPPSLGAGRGNSTPVQFVLGGTNYDDLVVWRDMMLEEIAKNPQLTNVDYDYKETQPQMKVSINATKAADLGVSIRQIGTTLQTLLGSREITTYIDRGQEYDLVLQSRDEDRLKPADMTNLYVRSERSGLLIPLSNLIDIKEVADAGSLNRYNRLRAITISANISPDYTLGEALDYLEQTARRILPAEAQIDYKGESQKLKESGAAVYTTFLLALIAVFLILAAQFESFVHPLVIMTAVPFALIGALWGLYMTGATLNVYTQIGMIMLVGLAAKNGILIVEFANQLRDEGVDFMEALIEACEQRLRPILMTSIATAAGTLPLIFAQGAGAESRFPIGIVICAGVIFSTFLTLFIVPTFYALLARRTKSPEFTARELEKQLEKR
ncbi:MAG: efflux RND transporter permease subunit [Micavibrio sp.]